VRTSRLAATSLDHSAILAVALSGNLSFNILVVLVLSVLILSGSAVFRAFWLDHSICRTIWLRVLNTASIVIALLEVVWESCTLSILMLLLQSCVILIALTRNAWQLLLRLRDSGSSLETWLTVLVLPRGWTTAGNKSYFLILILIMLDVKFRLTCLNLVAFLTDSFI